VSISRHFFQRNQRHFLKTTKQNGYRTEFLSLICTPKAHSGNDYNYNYNDSYNHSPLTGNDNDYNDDDPRCEVMTLTKTQRGSARSFRILETTTGVSELVVVRMG